MVSPAAISDSIRKIQARRRELELERVRNDADAIRARCSTLAGFFREAWHVLEPETKLGWNWHLQAICDHLEAITRGDLHPRLIVNVPPGSSKSTIISIMWQAWEWGPVGRPGLRHLSTSFEQGNVTRDTRKTRDLILSEWYQALWPMPLKRAGETSFENYQRGTREGVAFAAVTGKRGDRLTIDDPHSLDGAESEAEREKAVRRFIEGGQNRVNDQEKSAIVIVMQRLHEADLTGAVLARELGYIHLNLPMEFEIERRCETRRLDGTLLFRDPRTYDGELMDPNRMPQRAVDLLKKDNDYMWAGQYQQRPAPREGGMFKVDQILKVKEVPAGAVRVRGWDIAGSTRKRSPYTVGARLAYFDRVLYIEHIVRERAEIDKAERLIVATAHEDGRRIRQSIPQDPGSAGKSQKLHLANKLAGLDFIITTETGAKEDRAIPFASMVNAGSVRMVEAPWNVPLIEELRNFPGSAFKDQADALSRAFQLMAPLMREDDGDGIGAPRVVRMGADA
jgi:predicted phage terminase large subunit-like protein